MKTIMQRVALLAVALLCLNGDCQAHGFAGPGWPHPLLGLDQTLALLALGAWSAQLNSRAPYLVPSAFVVSMAVGGVAAFNSAPIPGAEPLIALSLLALGAAIAIQSSVASLLAAIVTLIFGLAHGYSFAVEMPPAIDKTTYFLGFLVTTAGLYVAGAVAALLMLENRHGPVSLRVAGVGAAIAGLGLLR